MKWTRRGLIFVAVFVALVIAAWFALGAEVISNTATITYHHTATSEELSFTSAPSSFVRLSRLPGLSASPAIVLPGGTITQAIDIEGAGDAMQVKQTLATGYIYVAGSSTLDGTAIADPTVASGTVTWEIPVIAQNVTKRLSYKIKVP